MVDVTQELKPCECGGAAELRISSDGEVEWCCCTQCGANGPVHYSRAEAVRAWNTRTSTAPDAEPVAVADHPVTSNPVGDSETGNTSAKPVAQAVEAWTDVLAERTRQMGAEGWSPEHDDSHAAGQLAGAAACYALAAVSHWAAGPAIQQFWPWDQAWWKPADPRRNLVKAAALLLAEIERLDRAALAAMGERSALKQGEPR